MTSTAIWKEVRSKLFTVDDVIGQLKRSEPLAQVTFPTKGTQREIARFDLGPRFLSDPSGIRIGQTEYKITSEAVLEATSAIGLTQSYVQRTPHELIQPHLNYWFANREGEMKALVSRNTVKAFTKATIVPFSNVKLVQAAIDGLKSRYGAKTEVLVDYKFHHTLKDTAVRLVVPAEERAVREGDVWSAGLQVRNSLTGTAQTALEAYLFRWECTNGMISTHDAGRWHRKRSGQDEGSLLLWAQAAVDEILGGLEHEFDAIEELASTKLPFAKDGSPDVTAALADVFEQYRIPPEAREIIIENLVNSDDLTMYGIMQGITEAANHPDVGEKARVALMEIGGDLPRANTTRCTTCKRIMAP